jgi:lincosamide nucleotidyltransferase A/C/D/E
MQLDPGGMSSREVLRIVAWIDSQQICYQINGGWAVDALVGRQTRTHRDLDLFVDADVVPRLLSWLRSEGYVEEVDELPARVELCHDQSRVDVHPMTLDCARNGSQRDSTGEVIYTHPAAARTTGTIGGHPVCVGTASRLRELRDGYSPREVDRHDLRLLDEL